MLGPAIPIRKSLRNFYLCRRKGVGVITSFVAVPLTVRYLGAERYGAGLP